MLCHAIKWTVLINFLNLHIGSKLFQSVSIPTEVSSCILGGAGILKQPMGNIQYSRNRPEIDYFMELNKGFRQLSEYRYDYPNHSGYPLGPDNRGELSMSKA